MVTWCLFFFLLFPYPFFRSQATHQGVIGIRVRGLGGADLFLCCEDRPRWGTATCTAVITFFFVFSSSLKPLQSSNDDDKWRFPKRGPVRSGCSHFLLGFCGRFVAVCALRGRMWIHYVRATRRFLLGDISLRLSFSVIYMAIDSYDRFCRGCCLYLPQRRFFFFFCVLTRFCLVCRNHDAHTHTTTCAGTFGFVRRLAHVLLLAVSFVPAPLECGYHKRRFYFCF